jgi:hypothetical protein
MAKKSKHKCSDSADVRIIRGQIIPATVIEEKQRRGGASSHADRAETLSRNSYEKCEKITSKLRQNLKWDKFHEWLARCNFFSACMHLFEEEDEDDGGNELAESQAATQVYFRKVVH